MKGKAGDPERFAAMRAEAVEAHPANMKRSGTMFEGAVRARMIGAVLTTETKG